MRHRVSRRKLGRPTDQRENLLRSLVTSLIIHEKLVTTVTRAKEARILCEKVITYGKKGTLHHRRLALAALPNSRAVGKVFDVLGPRYNERAGGYTRVIKLDNRKNDNAITALIEFVSLSTNEDSNE